MNGKRKKTKRAEAEIGTYDVVGGRNCLGSNTFVISFVSLYVFEVCCFRFIIGVREQFVSYSSVGVLLGILLYRAELNYCGYTSH